MAINIKMTMSESEIAEVRKKMQVNNNAIAIKKVNDEAVRNAPPFTKNNCCSFLCFFSSVNLLSGSSDIETPKEIPNPNSLQKL